MPTCPVFTRAKNKVSFWDFSQFAVTKVINFFLKKCSGMQKKKEISLNFLFLELISQFVISSLLMACKRLFEFEKGQIVAYNECGLSLWNIANKLNHQHSSTDVFLKNYFLKCRVCFILFFICFHLSGGGGDLWITAVEFGVALLHHIKNIKRQNKQGNLKKNICILQK